ncbi:hypothetical protein H0H93_011547 [Arthromyces matolae]|nr:hypothetical protein H0H93_011547 [Arthromyces matolae]
MSTMLETFDSQMVDFQTDTDYTMQPSSSDNWFKEESYMEGENHTTVEVDMDTDTSDEQHREFEMEDDQDGAEAALNDLYDVEVHDAPVFQYSEVSLDDGPIVVVEPTEDISFAKECPETTDPPSSSSEYNLELAFDAEYQHDFVPLESLDQGSRLEQNSPHSSDPAIGVETAFGDPSPHSEGEGSADSQPATVNFLAAAEFDSGGSFVGGHEDVEGSLVKGHQIVEEADDDYGGDEDSAEATETHEQKSSGDEGVSYDDTSHGVEENLVVSEAEDSTSDPHEISEGVYIDPPPPVLLSLVSEGPTFTLFNSPSNHHPESLKDQSHAPEYITLLGQHPTLYYEPLSSVFDAIRQEDYFFGVPNLLSGELFLDAYDLELTMSEDYTYTRELSLHDLNVLHDGLNKPGPLRLRLRAVLPRFIDRYHALQNQIVQLPVAQRPADDFNEGEYSHVDQADMNAQSESTTDGQVDVVADSSRTPNQNTTEESSSFAGHQLTQEPERSQKDAFLSSEEATNTSEQAPDSCIKDQSDIPQQRSGAKESDSNDLETLRQKGRVEGTDDGETPALHPSVEKKVTSNVEGTEIELHEEVEGIDISALEVTSSDGNLSLEDMDSLRGQANAFVADPDTERFDPTSDLAEERTKTARGRYEVAEDNVPVPDKEWTISLSDGSEWQDSEAQDGQEHDTYEYEDALYDEPQDPYDDHNEYGHGHEPDTVSNSSSVTLSSKSSFKRTLSEAEFEEYEAQEPSPDSPPGVPSPFVIDNRADTTIQIPKNPELIDLNDGKTTSHASLSNHLSESY